MSMPSRNVIKETRYICKYKQTYAYMHKHMYAKIKRTDNLEC